ncbi:MAG: DUF2318 domain-containing protein [Desulfovibrio sp.]|jgi:uncharacterized membrane protein|nr:DUF2318 domain-containing protein [Desulfovibrio sp.]
MRLILSLLLVLLCTSRADAFFGDMFGDSVKTVIARDGRIIIDVADLEPSRSRHYLYDDGRTAVRFFIVRDNKKVVRAAVDACEVCWREKKGYVMQDGAMVCLNCGRKFPMDRIGMTAGGCNPHPLKFDMDNASVVISADELSLGAKYFF